MGLRDLLMRKMLASKLKGVPQEQQDKIFAMIEKNPQFFQNIAAEVQEKMKQGKDQMTATMEVMSKYQDQIKGMM